MPDNPEKLAGLRILAIRLALAVVFAFVLQRFFFPQTGPGLLILFVFMLVGLSYVTSALHNRNGGSGPSR